MRLSVFAVSRLCHGSWRQEVQGISPVSTPDWEAAENLRRD